MLIDGINTGNISTNTLYSPSATEKDTGRLHPVSGKTLYTIVVSGTTDGSASDFTKSTGLTGVDQCAIVNAVIDLGNGRTSSSSGTYNSTDSLEFHLQCDTNGTNIYGNIATGSANWQNRPYYVILEYTKT